MRTSVVSSKIFRAAMSMMPIRSEAVVSDLVPNRMLAAMIARSRRWISVFTGISVRILSSSSLVGMSLGKRLKGLGDVASAQDEVVTQQPRHFAFEILINKPVEESPQARGAMPHRRAADAAHYRYNLD